MLNWTPNSKSFPHQNEDVFEPLIIFSHQTIYIVFAPKVDSVNGDSLCVVKQSAHMSLQYLLAKDCHVYFSSKFLVKNVANQGENVIILVQKRFKFWCENVDLLTKNLVRNRELGLFLARKMKQLISMSSFQNWHWHSNSHKLSWQQNKSFEKFSSEYYLS